MPLIDPNSLLPWHMYLFDDVPGPVNRFGEEGKEFYPSLIKNIT